MTAPSQTGRRRYVPASTLLGSLVITLLFGAVFGVLWRMSEDRIDTAFAAEADKVRDGFALLVEGVHNQMQALATMVAGDKQVQSLFDLGAWMVGDEGGGPGASGAAEARSMLLSAVQPQWLHMQRRFGARQLHFHLAKDGAVTSFLRVHVPDRFGDRLESVRRIIADVAEDGVPRAGFEVGRIYSGLRGVVPVVVDDGVRARRIGVLEAGTSFDVHLDTLDRQFGGGVAVLLRRELVDTVVWDEFVTLNGPSFTDGCSCYVEASSRPDILDWMRDGLIRPLRAHALETHRVERAGRTYNLIRFPLRDYAGTADPSLPRVGSVAVWTDRTALVAEEREALLTHGGLTLGAYLLALGLFLWGAAYARRRRAAERALEAERGLFAGGPVAVFLWRPEDGWPVAHASSNVKSLLGHDAATLMAPAFRFTDLVHPDDRPRIAAEVADHLAAGRSSWEQSYRLFRADGSVVWVYDFTIAERSRGGAVTALRGYLVDQSQQRALQEEVARARRDLDFLLSASPAVTYSVPLGGDGGVGAARPYMSPGVTSMLGYEPADVLRDPRAWWLATIHPDDRAGVAASMDPSRWINGMIVRRYRLRHAGGAWRWVEDRCRLAAPAEGEAERLVGSLIDITEQVAAQEALRETRERFELAVFGADLGVWDWHVPSGRVTFDERWAAMLGYDVDEIAPDVSSWERLVHPDDAALVEERLGPHLRGEAPHYECEHRLRHKDGGWVWVLDRGKVLERDTAGNPVRAVGTHLDITARKRAEAARLESEERYRSVVAAMAEGVVIQDRAGQVVAVNPAAERILGASHEDLVGVDSTDDRWAAIRPDGTPYPWEEYPAMRCLGDGRSVRGDVMGLTRPGGDITWISINAEPLRQPGAAEGDPPAAVVTSFSDITARQKMEQELLRSNAELEQFAYVASHDLRQPLRMISSYLTLVDRALGQSIDSDVKEFLGFAVDGAKRMDHLIVDLLEYSRIGRQNRPLAPLALNQVLADAVTNLTVPIAEAGAVVEVAPDLPTILGDHGEMVRLFQNLIGNAVKYTAPDRPPRVDVTWRKAPRGEGWIIAVRDNGTGIDPKHFERIFGVFQRLVTRSQVEGTGIGLAVCRKIAEHHGGRIWVESTPGEGSTFNVALPRHRAEAAEAAGEAGEATQ